MWYTYTMTKINFCNLYTKTNIYNMIETKRQARMLGHAYLFVTKDSMTEEYITRMVAEHIMGEGAGFDPNSDVALKIEHGNHVDVRVYPRSSDVILVDDLKDIIYEAYIRPTQSQYKIFVLKNFDDVGVLSQNKLLKVLEEPPTDVIFLLGCVQENKVLQTIRSRCEIGRLADFSDSDITQFLTANGANNMDVVKCASGSLEVAYKLAFDEKFNKIHTLAHDLVYNLSSSLDAAGYARRIIDAKELDTLCDEIVRLLHENVSIAANNNNMTQFKLSSKIMKIALVTKKKFLASGNLNILADNLILQILEAKYLCKK